MIKMIDYAINQQVLPDGNFVFLDCETANKYNEICQIAAIIVQDGKIIKIINEYVKPKNKFSYKYHTEKHQAVLKMQIVLMLCGRIFLRNI